MEKNQVIFFICFASLLLILLLGFLLFILLFQRRKSNKFIREREVLKTVFNEQLLKAQLEVQEQTMQTIGADLHDNIGQLLSLTALTLSSIEADDIPAKSKQKIDASIDLTLRSIKEMRQLGKLLQGDQLTAMGLSEAIRYEINWMERSGKYEINYLREDEMPEAANPNKDLIIFRILQEVLNNIIKHSAATQINVKLGYADGALHLIVRDNGIGFDANTMKAEQSGMGLQNIQKRAAIIGGEATIISNPGKGTLITISIQYP